MNRLAYLVLALLAMPLISSAQTPGTPAPAGPTIGTLAETLLNLLDGTVVRVIFAIAFIVFLWFVFQYFIAGGAEEEQRSKGRQFVMWAVIGFFVMFSIWGIVNLLLNTIILNKSAPCVPTFANDCAQN